MRDKTAIDIIKEKRHGKAGYGYVVWDYIGGLFYPRSGWIYKEHLFTLFPKERYNINLLKEPHGHFGLPYDIKKKRFEYLRWE